MIFDKFFKVISFGSLPLNPGIDTISFSLFSPGHADPNLIFSNSACFSIIEQPSLISSVITFPPNGITDVCLIIPSLKMAKSVVPPQYQLMQLQLLFPLDSILHLKKQLVQVLCPQKSIPALLIHLAIF